MARIIRMEPRITETRHLYWRFNRSRFVTVCDDGSVILDGAVMTLAQATSRLLREEGIPPGHFWCE